MSAQKSRVAGKLGRLTPYDPASHPRLRIRDFLTTYPEAPPKIDYISQINDWPMYLNDQLGCCTVAAAGHMIEAWTQMGQGKAVEIADDDVLKAYEAVSGYEPGHPETDKGAVMQDVLDYWRTKGIGGHKILAFAEVDVKNQAELTAAMALFGHVYLGINFPAVAMDQFRQGKPWDVVPDDGGIEGGHAIDWGYAARTEDDKIITWGRPQGMTQAFFDKYVEEAWVSVSQEWMNEAGLSPQGLDVGALGKAFHDMTGEPDPFPAQPKPQPPKPHPKPGPHMDPADMALSQAMDAWRKAKGIS